MAQSELPIATKAPALSGIASNGNRIVLSELVEEGPVVVVFYRGQWCKYCNYYMASLEDSLHLINEQGAKVIAVTPEKNSEIEKIQKKTDASFDIVYDKGHTIMDAWKVSWKMGRFQNFIYKLIGFNINKASENKDRVLPVPATYIVNRRGELIGGYFNTDYSKRMPVSEIVRILNENKINK